MDSEGARLSESEETHDGNPLPSVSVLVPIRNEEGYISRCLDSILSNDYPLEKLEILVIDGRSSDGSREIVKEYIEKSEPKIRLLDNPQLIVPTAMNIGLKEAKGDVIIRIDGHSFVEGDFISTSVRTLIEKEVEAVGGPVRPVLDDSSSYLTRAISAALKSPLASGSARFNGKRGYVTTVSFGAYWSDVFKEYGDFDERFVRTQDYEMNYRIVNSGGRIFMNPDIKSYYYPRKSLFNLWKQYFQFGYWKTKVMKKYGELLSLGNLLPPLFVVGIVLLGLVSVFVPGTRYVLLASLGAYVVTATYFGLREVNRAGDLRSLPGVILALATIHFGFGLGFLKGLFFDLKGRLTLPWRGLNDG